MAAKVKEWVNDPEGFKSWLDNPHWAAYYNDAPSEMCKKRVMLDFYYSDMEDDEAAEAMDQIEKKLALNDWK